MLFLLLTALTLPFLAATESLIIWNPLAYHLSTLTIKATDATATTYENVCPSTTATPKPTPAAQSGTFASSWQISECMPLSMTQGPSTWEYSNSNSLGEVKGTCSFSGGAMPSGTGVCTYTAKGPIATIFASTESQSGALNTLKGFETVQLVTPTGDVSSHSSQPTTSANGTASASSTAKDPAKGMGARSEVFSVLTGVVVVAGGLGSLALAVGL